MEVSIGGISSSFRAFVAGVQDRPARTAHEGSQEGVGVHLNALGVSRLLGVPGAELANRCIGIEDVLGHGIEARVDQLSGVAAPRERTKLVEAALAERLGGARTVSTEVVWVWGKLRKQPSACVADLAAEVGWSRTPLAYRFSDRSGSHKNASPGSFASRRPAAFWPTGSSSLAEVAARAGYYDQPHLCRDVSVLAGCTPAELASGGPPDP